MANYSAERIIFSLHSGNQRLRVRLPRFGVGNLTTDASGDCVEFFLILLYTISLTRLLWLIPQSERGVFNPVALPQSTVPSFECETNRIESINLIPSVLPRIEHVIVK